MTPDRIFNMDETGFGSNQRTKKVIAAQGSKNVWTKTATTNCHMTITACVSAVGLVIPPLFILEGKRVNRDILDACSVFGSTVTTSAKGFMNSMIFLKWLEHFENNVPGDIKRPLLLVFDGYTSHYSDEIIEKAIQLKVLLILLPANATHLIQPLDVAVFRSFKLCLKTKMHDYMIDNQLTSFQKKDVISIASSAWNESIVDKVRNIRSGFRASGLWPPSLAQMALRLKEFKNGAADESIRRETWIKTQQVIRAEVLLVPATGSGGGEQRRRKTLDVNNRLFTQEQLHRFDD